MPGKDTQVYPISGEAEAAYIADWLKSDVPEDAVLRFKKKVSEFYGSEEKARHELGLAGRQ